MNWKKTYRRVITDWGKIDRKTFNLLRPEKWPFLIASGLFITAFGGALIVSMVIGLPDGTSEGIVSNLKKLETPLDIFINNAIVYGAVLSGVGTMGFTTVLFLLLNGAYMGLIVGFGLQAGYDVPTVIALVAPHAIFEFPAFWLAGSVGLTVPIRVVEYLRNIREDIITTEDFYHHLMISVGSLLLLAVGAFVEGVITPKLAAMVS